MNGTFDFNLGSAFSGKVEVDPTLRHKGAMVCRCQAAVGGQLWPLSVGVSHVDKVCTWFVAHFWEASVNLMSHLNQ